MVVSGGVRFISAYALRLVSTDGTVRNASADVTSIVDLVSADGAVRNSSADVTGIVGLVGSSCTNLLPQVSAYTNYNAIVACILTRIIRWQVAMAEFKHLSPRIYYSSEVQWGSLRFFMIVIDFSTV